MNAFSFEMIAAVNDALDEIEKPESKFGSVVIAGNSKAFSAGFDLSIMGKKSGGDDVAKLFQEGSKMVLRLFEFKLPVVMASTGHSLALGAIMLLAGDLRLGVTSSKAKIGMNEVHIGMTLPVLGIELARHRIPKSKLIRATTLGAVVTMEEAVSFGYLDWLVDGNVVKVAIEEADKLCKIGGSPGFIKTKSYERGDIIRTIRASMDVDVARLSGSKL
eukprot:UC4_evm5s804